jgi:hypothetical protein
MVTSPVPRSVIVAPFLWAAIGATAAFALGIWQDLGLAVISVIGAYLVCAGRTNPDTRAAGLMMGCVRSGTDSRRR